MQNTSYHFGNHKDKEIVFVKISLSETELPFLSEMCKKFRWNHCIEYQENNDLTKEKEQTYSLDDITFFEVVRNEEDYWND
jgi:hypothetical protein